MDGFAPNARLNFDGGADGKVVLNPAAEGTGLAIPGGAAFLNAEFVREGYDLTLDAGDAGSVVIPDYFLSETPPNLIIDGTSIISGDLASKLAGPMAPGQYAQLQQADPQGLGVQALGAPIGSVTELEGSVLVTRVDGTQVSLNAGDSIYQGDNLTTGADGNIGVVFADDTTFSLDANGSMVLDEMVYDPDTQTGVFEATVVKGVFSFVSGQVAKTGTDAMTINTPKTTIGIRGSTGLVKAGGEEKITLIPDIDGNVGELTVSNQAGSQVLNQPNASTTVASAFQPPAPVVFLSPQEIQQDYGKTLTTLVKTEAKKAVAKADQATRKAEKAEEQAAEQKEEADKAEQEAAEAEAEAEAAAAEAEALAAEAEAAKAEAEAATDAEAKAEAEAKVAEAEAKAAEAEAKATAESEAAATKVAEAFAKAEAAGEAEQEAILAVASKEAAAQFSQMAGGAAKAQQDMFKQFVELGPQDPVPGPLTPKGTIFIGADGRGITKGGDDKGIIIGEDGGAKGGNIVDVIIQEIAKDVEKKIVEDIPILAHTVLNLDGTKTHTTTDNDYVDTNFAETVTALNGGGAMSGGAGNTNFHFPWASLKGGSGGTYTITDAGGINQISFDGMDNVKFSVTATSSTNGTITVYSDQFGTPVSWATISYGGISQFLLADVTVSSFSTSNFQTTQSGNVLKLSSLSPGQTAYGIAGTDGTGETFAISGTQDLVAFGKGGDDIFDISSSASGHLLGGAGADTFNFTSFTDSWNVDGGSDGSVDHYNYAGWGTAIHVYASASGTVVQDAASSPSVTQSLTMDSPDKLTGSSANDSINISGGTYGTIDGDAGNDTFTITGGTITAINGTSGTNTYTLSAGSTVTTLTGGTAIDKVTIDSSHLAQSVTFDGGGGASDTLTIQALAGASVDLTSHLATISNFETTTVSAVSSTSGVSLTGYATASTTLDGSALVDTLVGGTANDIIQGQYSGDTLTGGGGVDTFVYYNKNDGGDTITDYAGDILKFSTTGDLGLGSKMYEAIVWDGSPTGLVMVDNGDASNVIVLTGGSSTGTITDVMTALVAGDGLATNAIVVFRDSANSNIATIAHTDNLAAGGSVTILGTMSSITADLSGEFTTADFVVSA